MNKFYDKNGIQIREFAIIKFYHYTGKRRRKYYMYKQVRMIGEHMAAFHLVKNDTSCWLKALANKEGFIDCEVVQDYSQPYIEY